VAIDARINLAGLNISPNALNVPDTGAIFSNALRNVQGIDAIRQNREQAPLRNALLQEQVSQAPLRGEALRAQVAGSQASTEQTQQLNDIRSLGIYANELSPLIAQGDLSGILQANTQRISSLESQGRSSEQSRDLQQFLTDPNIPDDQKLEEVRALASGAIALAQQAGVFGRSQVTGTASGRDFQTFQALQAKARQTGNAADIEAAAQFGRQAGFTRETAQELADIGVGKARGVAQAKAGVELATEPEIQAAVTTAVGEAEAKTELGAAELSAKRLAQDETKIKNEQERLELIGAKEAAIAEATRSIQRIDGLLLGDRFSSGFGKLVSNTPETLRSQEAIDVIAELDQIRGLVSLESRQKLKGQGTISDSESKTLEKSATVLSNPLISDNLARKELKIIKGVFEKSARRNALAKSTREGRLVKAPETNMTDNGDGTFTLPDGRIVRRKGG